jgi:hypothetical protein
MIPINMSRPEQNIHRLSLPLQLQSESDPLPSLQGDLAVLDFSLVHRADQQLGLAGVDAFVHRESLLVIAKVENDQELGSLVGLEIGKDLLVLEVQDLEVSVSLTNTGRIRNLCSMNSFSLREHSP